MSDNTPDITPDLLRSVAAWLRDNAVGALPGKPLAAEFLDGAADDLEREQADEKRVNYALAVWYDARANSSEYGPEIDRVGMRAVLAHLEMERAEKVHAPRKWARIEDVPADVGVVTNAYSDRIRRDPETAYGWRFTWDGGGDRAPVSRGSLAEHGPYTEVIDGE